MDGKIASLAWPPFMDDTHNCVITIDNRTS